MDGAASSLVGWPGRCGRSASACQWVVPGGRGARGVVPGAVWWRLPRLQCTELDFLCHYSQDQVDTLTFQSHSLRDRARRFEEALRKSTEERLEVLAGLQAPGSLWGLARRPRGFLRRVPSDGASVLICCQSGSWSGPPGTSPRS